ncbi:hypothetical protein [Neisseria polysaccharea]|uniref:hypothetical protein n=1 Tax=Neisseria polysaccharea TaxID=489 RepID=UPI00272B030A|nr:hypothetical protein [Neisseria polysaccharea]
MPSENGRRIIVKTYRAPFAVAKLHFKTPAGRKRISYSAPLFDYKTLQNNMLF